jgi:hypothetical protein
VPADGRPRVCGRHLGFVFAATLLALLLAGLFPKPTVASLALLLDRSTAPPGALVRGHTPGTGDLTVARGQALDVFLVEPAVIDQLRVADLANLTHLGLLEVDEAGDASITFRVPSVTPGRYAVLVHCEPCATGSAGRVLLPLAEIEVTSAGPETDTVPATGDGVESRWRIWLAIALLAASIAIIAMWSALSARR